MVFPNVEIIKEVPKESNSKGYGMDFGYTNDPTTLIQIYTWDNSIIFDELLYEHGLMNDWADEKDKDRSITGKLEWLEIGKSEQIFGDSAEPKSIDEIHRR